MTPDLVKQIVSGLRNSTNGGFLDIPTKLVKSCIDILAEKLSALFNRCILTGYFPKVLKIAEVIPVFKTGDRQGHKNYRPISLLSVLSKIFEKHLYNQLLFYLESNNILVEQQCRFRRGISTNVAIGKFLEQVIHGLNDGKFGIGVFLDLQKAFELVDKDILIEKLKHYGIRGVANNLLRNFLSDRIQYVKLNNVKSELESLSVGTP